MALKRALGGDEEVETRRWRQGGRALKKGFGEGLGVS